MLLAILLLLVLLLLPSLRHLLRHCVASALGITAPARTCFVHVLASALEITLPAEFTSLMRERSRAYLARKVYFVNFVAGALEMIPLQHLLQ